jgi:hypothetical protein
MPSDLFPFTYLSQRQLGVIFGASSHVIGQWLTDLGLKEGSRPTRLAWERGLCTMAEHQGRKFPSWHRKVVEMFEADGHCRAELPEESPNPSDTVTLVGPFTLQCNGGDGYTLVGGDGVSGIWVRGRANAEKLVTLLNLADRLGKLGARPRQEEAACSTGA